VTDGCASFILEVEALGVKYVASRSAVPGNRGC